ncbi:ABC transporter permease (plasmid) [Thermaerobacter sp. FW80]|nr:ABC transporter permease [Thermaerobacter sp. FW80]
MVRGCFHVFRTELRLARRGLFIWAGVMVGMVGVYLGLFPYVQDPVMVEALKAVPEALLRALSFTPSAIADVNSYHGISTMGYVVLLATIYGLMQAGGSVAREPDLGAVEFLYTRPVTRRAIMAAKVAAFAVLAVVLWLFIFAASMAVGLAVAKDDFDLSRQATTHLAGFVATLAAGGVAFAIAPFFQRTQTATSVAVGIGLGSFVVHALAQLSDRLNFLRYFTLQYYTALDRAAAGDPFVPGMLVLLGVFLAGSALGTLLLHRKDFA